MKMKIKKFNEINEGHFTDNPYIHSRATHAVSDDDIKKVNRSGRKAYIVNRDYELVEMKTKSDVRRSEHKRNHNFPHLVFLSDEKIDSIKGLVKNIGKTEELERQKIKLMFDYVLAFAQKELEGSDEDESEES